MKGPMSDCYVLAPNRSAALALNFLNEFFPLRDPAFDIEDPVAVLGVSPSASLGDVLEFLEHYINRDYSMYFRNTEAKPPYYAFLAYREDGCLILGLSGDPERENARELLERLEYFSGSKGYWSVEEAPVGSREDFYVRVVWR